MSELHKSPEEWAGIDASVVSCASQNHITAVIMSAIHDIAILAARLEAVKEKMPENEK